MLGLVIAIAGLAAPAAASANPLVVDGSSVGGTCSDARTPAQVSVATPWCTIVQAVKAAPSGTTVYVRGGTYPYQKLHGLGSRTDYVTFEPYGYDAGAPEDVTIRGISTASTGFLRFQGLHLVGNDASGFVPAARIYLYSHDIQFIDNELTGEGVFLQTARDVLLQGNYIHDVLRNCAVTNVGDGGGIFLIGANSSVYPSVNIRVLDNRIVGTIQDSLNVGSISNLTVRGNDMSTGHSPCGDHTDLVQIEGGAMGPINITNNVFHDGGQFILRNAVGLTIQDNLILRVNQWMQLVADPGARVINNTWSGGNIACTGCGSLLIRDYSSTDSFALPPFNYKNHMSGTVIENNVMRMFANIAVPTADYHDDYNLVADKKNSTGVRGTHTIFGVPTFQDTANGDYHLAGLSLGIDAADAAVAPSSDMLGLAPSDDPNVVNKGVGAITYRDIGALETQFASGSGPLSVDSSSAATDTSDADPTSVDTSSTPPPTDGSDPTATPVDAGSTPPPPDDDLTPPPPDDGSSLVDPSDDDPSTSSGDDDSSTPTPPEADGRKPPVAPPPPGHGTVSPPSPVAPPVFTVAPIGARAASAGRTVTLSVGCLRACTITATGTVSLPHSKHGLKLAAARIALAAGRTAPLTVRLPARARRAHGRTLRVVLHLVQRGPSGTSKKTLTLRVRVRGRR